MPEFDQFGGRLIGPAPTQSSTSVDQFGGRLIGPAPQKPVSLGERFLANMVAGRREGTIAGALTDLPSIEKPAYDLYQTMPSYDGIGEGAVSLAGQIVGGMTSPEAFVGLGAKAAGGIYKAVRGAAPVLGQTGARIATRGAEQAVINTAVDPAIQGLNISQGRQDGYNLTQTALAPALGFAIGGSMEGARLVFNRWLHRTQGARAIDRDIDAEPTPEEVSAFRQSPDFINFAKSNGITDPNDPRLATLESVLSKRRAEETNRSATIEPTGKSGIYQPAGIGEDTAASSIEPNPRILRVGPEETQRLGDIQDEITSGERDPASAPWVGSEPVQPQTFVAYPDGQVLPTPDPAILPAQEAIAARQHAEARKPIEDAFAHARRQSDRVDTGILDTQPAGVPEGPKPVDVYLDDGFPVEVIRQGVRNEGGRRVNYSTVRRYDPRTGKPVADAVEYEVPTRQLKQSSYTPNPRAAQDFVGRARGPNPPERTRFDGEPIRREPRQTYRATDPDRNTDFPGANQKPGGSDGGGSAPAGGRSPFPNQPEGPGPFRQYSRAEEDEILNGWARREQARQERDRAKWTHNRNRTNREYSDNTSKTTWRIDENGQTVDGQGNVHTADADGVWKTDENGILVDSAGRAVKFANSRDAARWAAANKQGANFDRVTVKANSDEVYLKANENYAKDAAERRNRAKPEDAKPAAPDEPQAKPEEPKAIPSKTEPQKKESDSSRVDSEPTPPKAEPTPPEAEPTPPPQKKESDSSRVDTAEVAPKPNSATNQETPITPETGTKPEPTETVEPSVTNESPPIKSAEVITPAGTKIRVDYEVVEADSIKTSDQKEYPQELQPRDRERASSQAQVNEIAQKIDPERLGENRLTSEGAPIIGPDGVVESGNGRVMGIRQAHETNPEGAKRYRDYIEKTFGVDTSGMKKPVLVRRRKTEMTTEERIKFTVESNERSTLGMSSTERAVADAKAISDDTMNLYRGGDLDEARNREFVRAIMRDAINKNDYANMIDAQGAISSDGLRRMENAILAKAYGDTPILAEMIESTDSNFKTIGGALLDSSGSWAKMRANAPKNLDITKDLIEAIGVVKRGKGMDGGVAAALGQGDMFSGGVGRIAKILVKEMFRNERMTAYSSRASISDLLTKYADEASKATSGVDMFGSKPLTPDDILDTIIKGRRNGRDTGQGGLDFTRKGNDQERPRDAQQVPGEQRGEAAPQAKEAGGKGRAGDNRHSVPPPAIAKAPKPEVKPHHTLTPEEIDLKPLKVVTVGNTVPKDVAALVEKIAKIIGIGGEFKLTVSSGGKTRAQIVAQMHSAGYRGSNTGWPVELWLNSDKLNVKEGLTPQLSEAIAHELGHALEVQSFRRASPAVQKAVKEAFAADYNAAHKNPIPLDALDKLLPLAIGRDTIRTPGLNVDKSVQYFTKFEEWFANQVSKWTSTSEIPKGVVARFFSALSRKLKDLYRNVSDIDRMPTHPMKEWLDRRAEYFANKREISAKTDADATPKGFESSNDVGKFLFADRDVNAVRTDDNHMSMYADNDGNIIIDVVPGEKTGGKYFNDEAITKLTGPFKKYGGAMRATMKAANLDKLIGKLHAMGRNLFDDAENITHDMAVFLKNMTPEEARKAVPGVAGKILAREIDGARVSQRQIDSFLRGATTKSNLSKVSRFLTGPALIAWRSNGANMHMLAAKYAEATSALQTIADKIATNPGSGRKIDETFEQAFQTHWRKETNRLSAIVGVNNIQNEAFMMEVRDALSGAKTPRSPEVRRVAKGLRAVLDDNHKYLKDAGVDIGTVEGEYFPRIIDTATVLSDPQGFKDAAERAIIAAGADANAAKVAAQNWYEREIGMVDTFFDETPQTFAAQFTKGRKLPPEADKIMREFYVKDPAEVINKHILQSARRAEFARRFGENGSKYTDMINEARRSGVDAAHIQMFDGAVRSSLGLLAHGPQNMLKNVGDFAQVWGTMALLGHSVLSSISEPIAIGVRSNNAINGLRAFSQTMGELVKNTKNREIAEIIGTIGSAAHDSIVASHFGDLTGNKWGGISTLMFRLNGLEQLTAAQRVAATTIGRKFVGDLLSDTSKYAKHELAEIGLSLEDAATIKKWLSDNESSGDLSYLSSNKPQAQKYRAAIARFVDEAIQNPKAVDRPYYANDPRARAIFGITSFLFASTKNVLKRTALNTVRALNPKSDLTPADRMRMMGVVPAMLLLMAGNVGIRRLRDYVENNETYKDRSDVQQLISDMSASNITGTLDPLIQIMSSIRYQRNLSESVAGPQIGAILGLGDSLLKTIPRNMGGQNTRRTNTAEWNASRSIYRYVAAPAILTALSLTPGGPITKIGLGAASLVATSPASSRKFADTLAGKKKNS